MTSLLFRDFKQVAFISPHPDDVELCCGMLITRLIDSNVKVIYFGITDGAPSTKTLLQINHLPKDYRRYTYKKTRRQETINALSLLGITTDQIRFFDFPDLECYKSIPALIFNFSKILKTVDSIFCCPFEGGHPDHDICRFALAIAIKKMNYSGKIFEYASYNSIGYQVFESNLPKSFSIVANAKERKIKKQVSQIFVSQKEEAKLFRNDIEFFRQMSTTFVVDKFFSYPIKPYYEQWAYSMSIVLKEIQNYLKSTF